MLAMFDRRYTVPFTVLTTSGSYSLASISLLVSSLFRPGAEIILVFILFLRFIRKDKADKVTLIAFLAIVMGALHSLYGYLLAYPTKGSIFQRLRNIFSASSISNRNVPNSLRVIRPYLETVISQAAKPTTLVLLLFAVKGSVEIFRKHLPIKYLGISILATLILPAGAFVYGVINNIQTADDGIYVCLSRVWAFAIQHSAPRPFTKTKLGEYVLVSLGFLCIVLFVIFSGLRLQGKYEVKPDGTGLIHGGRLDSMVLILIQTGFYQLLITLAR